MELNEQQKRVVKTECNHVLCMAGAGSGKTRCLVSRVAHLVNNKHYSGYSILCLTFTRKAAQEMRTRLEDIILERENRKLIIGTYHSVCYKMLRDWGSQLGYKSNPSIYDENDSNDVVNKVNEDLGLKLTKKLIKDMFFKYSSGHEDFMEDPRAKQLFTEYFFRLKSNNALDYTQILRETNKLLEIPQVKNHYRNLWKHVLVDEIQDTDFLNYSLHRNLDPENLFCVGDLDQAIYGWRGAVIEVILNFEKDYPDAEVHMLERNYRSTAQIVKLANNLIKHNSNRYEKQIWTNRDGEPVDDPKSWFDTDMEEIAVGKEIIRLKREIPGLKYSDIAVISRVNWMLESIDFRFKANDIPCHRASRDQDFYKCEEIRQCLNLFRIYTNQFDNHSFKKLLKWNIWQTHISDSDMLKLQHEALQTDKSLYQVFKDYYSEHLLCEILKKELIGGEGIVDIAMFITGRIASIYHDKGLDTRVQNIIILAGKISDWSQENNSNDLSEFLQNITMSSIQDSVREDDNKVKLLTIHGAKGLEFKVVFIVGVAEGIFPSRRDEDNIEESRRLFYVGVTRAKDLLKISYPRTINRFGKEISLKQSRFLEELE